MYTERDGPGMTLAELRVILRVLDTLACRYWLEGGWGVDALVGRQTRFHRDVDVDFDASREAAVVGALADLGYRVQTDWRPNRIELAAPDRGWVDLHPLVLLNDGSARQASLDGGFHTFPASWFTVGLLDEQPVPCVSAAAQRLFHTGYEQRDIDVHDLELLAGLDA